GRRRRPRRAAGCSLHRTRRHSRLNERDLRALPASGLRQAIDRRTPRTPDGGSTWYHHQNRSELQEEGRRDLYCSLKYKGTNTRRTHIKFGVL
uniref:Uncharacterized protein n=1 Tax=Oryza punctata TaxID=4537 RepID=A0A0E0L4Y8_ORYPU